jgi:hypothetical protein
LRISDAPALPAAAAETYTAHSTALPAVQFNTVYLTPCTAVPSFNFGAASDKRSSLWIAIHNGKRLSDAPLKLARRTGADGVG